MNDDLSPEDQAFLRADEFKLGSLDLKGFGYAHQSAAIELGVRYWKLEPGEIQDRVIEMVFEDGRKESRLIHFYDSQIHDAAIVLWLLSLPIEKVKEVRRTERRRRNTFEDEIDAFAKQHRIVGGGLAVNGDALGIFFAIMSDVELSTAQLEENSGEQSGEKKTL